MLEYVLKTLFDVFWQPSSAVPTVQKGTEEETESQAGESVACQVELPRKKEVAQSRLSVVSKPLTIWNIMIFCWCDFLERLDALLTDWFPRLVDRHNTVHFLTKV